MPSPGKPVLSARIEFCERPHASIAQERRKHSVGVEKAGNGQRDRPRRNRRQIRETAVENLLRPAFPIELHDFNRADVSKIGGRIIEGNVPVHAYPEADNVDGRGREKSRIIGRTPFGPIVGIHQMNSSDRQVVEEGRAQPSREELGCSRRQADIFVHVKCRHAPPVNSGFVPQRIEHFPLARRGGEDDSDRRLALEPLAQIGRDVARRHSSHGLPIRIGRHGEIGDFSKLDAQLGPLHRTTASKVGARTKTEARTFSAIR